MINYKKFSKHAERLVKESNHLSSRPILQGVKHGDNFVAVTNSHYMYYAKNINAPKNTVIHAVTGEDISDVGNYPEIDKLFSDPNDAKMNFTIPASETINIVKSMQQAGSYSGVTKKKEVPLHILENKLHLSSINPEEEPIHFLFNLNIPSDEIEEPIVFNSQMFLNSLEMFKDMGVEEVTLYYYGSLRPFIMLPSFSDDLLALILPIRSTNHQ